MLRITRILVLAILSGLVFSSCEKEYSEENGLLPGGGGGVGGTAVFSFDGSPGNCVAPVIGGSYQVGTALGASNTVQLAVTVVTPGTYTISTSSANGMSFAGSGSFTTSGAQTVTLTGSGTPSSAVTTAFTPGSTGCSFNINVTGAPTGDFLRCKIDGVLTNFNTLATANYLSADTLSIGGLVSMASIETMEIQLIGGTNLAPGTYKEEGAVPGATTFVEAGYLDNAFGIWYIDIDAPTPRPNPFTVVITSISATRVEGTFEGAMFDAGGSPATKQFTEGSFSLPIN